MKKYKIWTSFWLISAFCLQLFGWIVDIFFLKDFTFARLLKVLNLNQSIYFVLYAIAGMSFYRIIISEKIIGVSVGDKIDWHDVKRITMYKISFIKILRFHSKYDENQVCYVPAIVYGQKELIERIKKRAKELDIIVEDIG